MSQQELLDRIEALEKRLAQVEPKTHGCPACGQRVPTTGRRGAPCPNCGQRPNARGMDQPCMNVTSGTSGNQ